MKMIRESKAIRTFLGVLLMFSLFAGVFPAGIVTAYAAQDNAVQENAVQENVEQDNAVREDVEQDSVAQDYAAQDNAPVEEDLNGDGIFEKNADNTMFGTAQMAAPAAATGKENWQGSFIYFGKDGLDKDPIFYRVLDKETTDFNKPGHTTPTVFLDCNKAYHYGRPKYMDMGRDEVEWETSNVKARLYDEWYYSDAEGEAVARSYKSAPNSKDGPGSDELEFTPLTGEKLFILDAAEATNSSYGYPSKCMWCTELFKGSDWWLRSKSTREPDYIPLLRCDYFWGYVALGGVKISMPSSQKVGYEALISPALNISLPKILFSSAISGEKGALNSKYKLTLLSDDVSADLSDGEKATVLTVKKTGYQLTIPYTVAGEGANKVNAVSVLFMEGTYDPKAGNSNKADILYYGRLDTGSEFSKTGVGSVLLPGTLYPGLWGSNFKVYLIAEQMNGNRETDFAGNPVEILKSDVNYASAYAVTFDVNGHGTAPAMQAVIADEKAVKPKDPFESDLMFKGWYTDKDCTAEKKYDFNEAVKDNLTLYAKWGNPECRVTFDMNGGDVDKTPADQVIRNGNCAKEPAGLRRGARGHREGYYFDGWCTKKEGGEASRFQFWYPVEDDITLYAYWKKICTISYDKNGGKGDVRIPLPHMYGEFYTFPACELTPPAADQDFICWTDKKSGKKYLENSSYRIYDDLDLKADWYVPTYRTVRFVDEKNGNTTEVKVLHGKEVSYDQKPADPVYDNCTFLGWYTLEQKDNIADDKYLYDFDRSVTSDLTLYAAWLNEQKYHLIVKGEGGTISVDKEFAVFPEEVTFTVVPDPGYKLWYIHSAPHRESGSSYKLDNIYPKDMTPENTYTVQMPSYGELKYNGEPVSNINITALFEADHEHICEKHKGTPPECEGTGTYGYAECTVCHHKFVYDEEKDRVETGFEDLTAYEGEDLYRSRVGYHGRVNGFEEPVEEKAPTCSSPGNVWYKKCNDCGRYIPYSDNSRVAVDHEDVLIPIDPNAHDWDTDNVTYTWADDNSTVTASYTCKLNPEHKIRETVATTKTVTKEATCDEDGIATYTASGFTDPAFAVQTKTNVIIKKLGHDWNEPEYEWSDDFSKCTATATCKRDGSHKVTETAEAEVTELEGARKYVVKFKNDLFETKSITTVKLSFDTGGKDAKNIPAVREIVRGTFFDEPEKHPETDGLKFAGWFSDKNYSRYYDFGTPIYWNTTVYVKWVSMDTELFTVSFDLNGKEGITPTSQIVEKGGMAKIPDGPYVEGFKCSGWYTTPDCKTLYDFSRPVDSDLVLYAGWSESDDNIVTDDNIQYVKFKINTKNTDQSELSVELATIKWVNYNSKKHVSEYNRINKSSVADVKIMSINSVMTLYATPVLKFKNNKMATASGNTIPDKKRPYFILSFKANKDATKAQKILVKEVNKELKTQPVYFNIEPADLSKAKVTAKVDPGKQKAAKVTATIGGITMKLGKKDYKAEFVDDKVYIAGQGNFKGRQEVNK